MRTIIKQVAIIWWEWNFWKFAWDLISQTWIKVKNISENTTQGEKIKIINDSQIIIFSIPISNIVETIRDYTEYLIWDKLVMDITWMKINPMRELKNLNVNEIVWTNPMFWPIGNNLKWKKIIFSEEKCWNKWKFVRRVLKKSWANLIKLSPEEHDEKMAIIQSLTHIMNIVFMKTIKDLWYHPEELEEIETPIYKLQSFISWRFLNQSWALYADMQMLNPYFLENVLPILINNLIEIWNIDLNKDKKNFIKTFNELYEFLWEKFIDKSIENTQKIDDILK